jgi:hypothetical protein
MLLERLGLGQVGRREFHCRFRLRLLHKPIRNPVHQLVGGITRITRPAISPTIGIGPSFHSSYEADLPPSLTQ